MQNTTDYSDYTVKISSEPSYYGSECTTEDASRIAKSLEAMISSQFPGINCVIYREGYMGANTTGPDDETIQEIDLWVQDNWTTAL